MLQVTGFEEHLYINYFTLVFNRISIHLMNMILGHHQMIYWSGESSLVRVKVIRLKRGEQMFCFSCC